MIPRCRHCGELIRRSYAQYDHGWTHEDEMVGVWCRRTMAEPDGASR